MHYYTYVTMFKFIANNFFAMNLVFNAKRVKCKAKEKN